MSFTVPVFVPLSKGLDLSKESTLGGDDLAVAENLDYSVAGAVRGRPSRTATKQVVARGVGALVDAEYITDDFYAHGLTPCGLERVRDGGAERVALPTQGRLFIEGDDLWYDRGPFACARTDRVAVFKTRQGSTFRQPVAQDFGYGPNQAWTLLDPQDHGYQRDVEFDQLLGTGVASDGNSARCGTTTAMVFVDSNNDLQFSYRADGEAAIHAATLAEDAKTPTGKGDAPSICCSHDSDTFFVAYLTTNTDEFAVLKVSATGTVVDTFTCGASSEKQIDDLRGIWVDNSPVADDRVVVALTSDDKVHIRVLEMAAWADTDCDSDSAALTSTYNFDEVVVGVVDLTHAWWCANVTGGPTASTGLQVGHVNPNQAASLDRYATWYGGEVGRSSSITWAIAHQPIVLNNRVYLTVIAGVNDGGEATTTATWLTLDLADWYVGGFGADTGSYVFPALVARGETRATVPLQQPASATTLADGSGWTFATLDWARFEREEDQSLTGLDSMLCLNRVSLSEARAAQVGESTVFSGSIPHAVQRGDAAELGFPFLGGPGLDVVAVSGGSMNPGDYGVVAVWRWVDDIGRVHRSAPSPTRTVTLTLGFNTIGAYVTNPFLCSHAGDVDIELYITDVDPTEDAAHFLQTTTTPNVTDGDTLIEFSVSGTPDTTTEPLYTDGGVFENNPVPGDGGVAVLGRRLWLAGAHTLYASKLLTSEDPPGFSDEGQLQVELPPAAGRIMALHPYGDKLLAFAERGVFMIQDGGPDNTGMGPDFPYPVRVSELGVAGPRSSVSTSPSEVVFCSTLSEDDPRSGGPWMIGSQGLQYLGQAPGSYLGKDVVPDVAYLPERQQLFIAVPDLDDDGAILMLDMRAGRWSTWPWGDTFYGRLRYVATANRHLTALGSATGSSLDEGGPVAYDGDPGTDAIGALGYAMKLTTKHLAANGQDGLGWSRVRSVTPMQAEGSGAHTMAMQVNQDYTRSSDSGNITMAAPSADTTWPSTRQAPEWRLPVQKCSTIAVTLVALPATARWAAIRLDVAPLAAKGPAKQRQ